jgi:hypothetical protein
MLGLEWWSVGLLPVAYRVCQNAKALPRIKLSDVQGSQTRYGNLHHKYQN